MQGPIVEQLPSTKKICLTALMLGISVFLILIWRLDVPRSLFYDESLYVQPAKAFLAGVPDTNPEVPPLGKYLIAASVKVLGDNAYGWRIVSVCFGVTTIVGMFVWLYLLLHDYTLALTGALLTVLNNFVYVMSRVAKMDIFLVGFLMCGLVAFTAVLEIDALTVRARRFLMFFSGAMFGLAAACKWNGIDTLGVVAIWQRACSA